MNEAPRLTPQPLLLELGAAIASAGFAIDEPSRVIAELGGLVSGAPARAVDKRRAEFLAGRWAARQALARLGVEATPGRSEGGLPIWPNDVTGSITHGAQRALAAAARTADVRSLGLDSERLMSTASAALCRRICGETELAELERALGRPFPHALTLAFSAKESLYKCLYPLIGEFMDFHAARVVQTQVSEGQGALRGDLTLELAVDWSAEHRQGSLFRARFAVSAEHVESAVILQP
jgi:enterobactin synthetase component D